jgi:hypothetical protein
MSPTLIGDDPGIHPISQEVLSKKMDCRVKPGNDVLTVLRASRWLIMTWKECSF